MTFLGLSYQSCFFVTQICETIYVFILDLKKKNEKKKLVTLMARTLQNWTEALIEHI